ncbi:YihY/virulence factor BrkB family protein [Ktedonosporobacter rubrisoli]|uniref:YihY/virulence factor BrkB family protein n=1 Tax=Ktedonosporobacter rubrisoli TaxID=2509675 RepID=A0A4P6K3A3_KTERU|nr:YihY/virulence factor BrkB family protein [Ktedonosporobacter rubrisoli]QBD82727.1 YihY/virulence factor BrkB family protein [Ktedonosporobacter rubrisoli]
MMESQVEKIAKEASSSPPIKTITKDIHPLQLFITKFNNDWSMNLAGLLAYNLLMAMLPISIAILGIFGLILGNNPDLLHNITSQSASILPNAASRQALDLATEQIRKNAGILLIIAILLALFGGSRLFITLEGCLNLIYRLRPRNILWQNVMAFGMLILFIILIPIMVFASAGPTFVFSVLEHTPLGTIPGLNLLFSLGGILGGLIAAFILFEAIFFVVPNQPMSLRNSWCGALVSAIALDIFLIVFPLYTAHFMGGYAGQIGFAVILVLFFYYFAVILMLGAEVNAFFFEKVHPLPNDLGTFVSIRTREGQSKRAALEKQGQNNHQASKDESASTAHGKQPDKEAKQDKVSKQTQVKQEQTLPYSGPSKSSTLLGVLAGSALIVVIELLRQRSGRK